MIVNLSGVALVCKKLNLIQDALNILLLINRNAQHTLLDQLDHRSRTREHRRGLSDRMVFKKGLSKELLVEKRKQQEQPVKLILSKVLLNPAWS